MLWSLRRRGISEVTFSRGTYTLTRQQSSLTPTWNIPFLEVNFVIFSSFLGSLYMGLINSIKNRYISKLPKHKNRVVRYIVCGGHQMSPDVHIILHLATRWRYLLQLDSSEPSTQSALPSHVRRSSIHWPLLHWNSYSLHTEGLGTAVVTAQCYTGE